MLQDRNDEVTWTVESSLLLVGYSLLLLSNPLVEGSGSDPGSWDQLLALPNTQTARWNLTNEEWVK